MCQAGGMEYSVWWCGSAAARSNRTQPQCMLSGAKNI